MTRVAILESDTRRRLAVEHILEHSGFTVVPEREALSGQVDLVLADPACGSELLAQRCCAPVIVVAEKLDPRCIVQSMKCGAADYLAGPYEANEVLACIERVLADCRGSNTAAHIASRIGDDTPIPGMIGHCAAMRTLYSQIQKVAPVESTVLIQGESGTGKELVARALHAQSSRRDAPIISLNCAAIPETLIESELFGHERGAFTGASQARSGLVEAADGGTLFLDEIGELPLEAQARLLRVLQQGEIRRLGSIQTKRVNVRLIAATHRDLHQLINTGKFREDLYYRLNVVTLTLPPLRERASDIPALAEYVLERTASKLNRPVVRLSDEALQAIIEYPWPGNVRELENAIERALILCDSPTISPDLLALERPRTPFAGRFGNTPAAAMPPTQNSSATTLDDYFVNFVLQNQESMTETELATRLGISRKSLWERRQRFSVPRTRVTKRALRNEAF